jgi:hypothetical protein
MVDLKIVKSRIEKVADPDPELVGADYYYVHIVVKTSFIPSPVPALSNRLCGREDYEIGKVVYLIVMDSSVNLN